jgi:hypothetical protein
LVVLVVLETPALLLLSLTAATGTSSVTLLSFSEKLTKTFPLGWRLLHTSLRLEVPPSAGVDVVAVPVADHVMSDLQEAAVEAMAVMGEEGHQARATVVAALLMAEEDMEDTREEVVDTEEEAPEAGGKRTSLHHTNRPNSMPITCSAYPFDPYYVPEPRLASSKNS